MNKQLSLSLSPYDDDDRPHVSHFFPPFVITVNEWEQSRDYSDLTASRRFSVCVSEVREVREPKRKQGASALQNSWITYPGIFLYRNPGGSRKVGEFVGAAGSNAGGVRKRIRGSRVAAYHRFPQGMR